VCGLRDKNKRQKIFTFIERKPQGITFLQETYTAPGDEISWKKDWKGEVIMAHGTTHSRGVAILIPQKLKYNIDKIIKDEQGRYIFLDGKFQDQELALLNYYAPTREKVNEQIQTLHAVLPLLSEYSHKLIWAGDFNNALTSEDNFGRENMHFNNAAITLKNIMEV
jgi:exonuclease III